MKRFFINLKLLYNESNNNICKFSGDLKYPTSTWIYSNLIKDDDLKNSIEQKHFTFSKIFFSEYSVLPNKGMKLNKKTEAVLIISTSDNNISDRIEKSLSSGIRGTRISNMFFDIESYTIDTDIIMSPDNCFYFSCIEPIVIDKKNSNGKKEFMSPKDSEYVSFFKRNIIRKTNCGLSESDINISIIQDTIDNGNKFAVKGINSIKSFKYDFMIHINSEKCTDIINKCYFSGFGRSNSQGYGMVQLKNI